MRLSIIFCFVLLIVASCKKPNDYPETPALKYKSLEFSSSNIGSLFTLTATVTDGDGDIGYKQDEPNGNGFDDPTSPYYYNFVITLQILDNNVWKDSTGYNISVRLPYLTPEGKNKGLNAQIKKTDFLPINFVDTIRFKAFVYDRATHKSNEIETPSFVINTY